MGMTRLGHLNAASRARACAIRSASFGARPDSATTNATTSSPQRSEATPTTAAALTPA
jgi:hypothetical protein